MDCHMIGSRGSGCENLHVGAEGGLACRTILDIPETRGDFWDFFAKHVAPGMTAGRTKIVLVDGEKLTS